MFNYTMRLIDLLASGYESADRFVRVGLYPPK